MNIRPFDAAMTALLLLFVIMTALFSGCVTSEEERREMGKRRHGDVVVGQLVTQDDCRVFGCCGKRP